MSKRLEEDAYGLVELIVTQWDVNQQSAVPFFLSSAELIVTQWDVNLEYNGHTYYQGIELIVTQWDVNYLKAG